MKVLEQTVDLRMTDADKAYSILSTLLPGKVFLPGTPSYELSQSTYFSTQAAEHSPSFITSPATTSDVSIALRAIADLDVKFAVRGGGYNLNSGAANVSNGIVINLRAMNIVVISDDKSFASIGGGAIWREVYSHLDTVRLAVSGGRVSDVGVGGFCLGGGISYFSAREGLVCDNILRYEIVLSSGEIIVASRTSHCDLWRALKGGGASNFGIVTRFDIRIFEQGPFYGGTITLPYNTLHSQVEGFVNLLLKGWDPFAAIILSLRWRSDGDNANRDGYYSIFSNLQYTKEGEEDPECLRPFTSIQTQEMNTMRVSTILKKLSDFDSEAGKYVKSGLRNQFATTTVSASLPLLQEIIRIWRTNIRFHTYISHLNLSISMQPLPPSYSSLTTSTKLDSSNVLGLDPSEGPLVLLLLSYNWQGANWDRNAEGMAQGIIKAIDDKAKQMGGWNRFRYANYAARWQAQDVLAGYGEENVRFLREVSQKYDAAGMWRGKCKGGLNLSE